MEEEKVKIYVMSKVQFHEMITRNGIDDTNVDEFIRIAFICIDDTSGDYYANPLFRHNHHNVLCLKFDDVEEDLQVSPTNKEMTKAFTEKDARRIIKFLESNTSVNTLVVHCAGGISRSGAVGQFALDYLNGDKESFKINNSHITPNAKVVRTLNQVHREKYVSESDK
jgi:predicted protein tyrosine phosphatase